MQWELQIVFTILSLPFEYSASRMLKLSATRIGRKYNDAHDDQDSSNAA